MQNKFDVVVVGSGFGGGTVALRMAEAGKSVCVLERGRRWRGKNLPQHPAGPDSKAFPELGDVDFFWGRQLWHPTKQRLGLYDMRQMINLQTLLAAGVGGGSLIWSNVVVEAPETIFAYNWPKGINLNALRPYYRLADPYLKPTVTPGVPGTPDLVNGRRVQRAELLRFASERVERPWSPVKLAVTFGDENKPAPNGHGIARQLGCNYCGICPAGCPQNAKNTVDITYIAAAEAKGAEVRTLHLVTFVEPLDNGTYRVHFRRSQPDGSFAEDGFVDGKQVVLSAGTLGTTELLLRAKGCGLLPHLSKALGSRFSVNGNVLSGAFLPRVPGSTIETNSGPAITSMIDYGNFVVEDHAGPTWSAGIVGASNLGRMTAFSLAMAGYKASPEEIEKKIQDLLVYVGVGQDSSSGRLGLNWLGMLAMDWPGSINNEPVVRQLHEAMSALATVLNRTYIPNILSLFNRPVTYHPLGGCPMADCVDYGVVDARGHVFGYPGLYIADGSIIPTAIGRNPAYTIAALSERIAQGMLTDDKQ